MNRIDTAPVWRGLSAALMLVLSTSVAAQSVETSAAEKASETSPKMVAGIVATLLGNVVNAGAQALANRFLPTTHDMAGGRPAPCYASGLPSASITQTMRDELTRSGCQVVGAFVGAAAQGLQQQISHIVSTTQPLATPLSVGRDGTPNYQGMRASALIVNESGQVIEERSLGMPFYAGEKFRLKVQSSFPGFLEISHRAPSGRVKQLFPKSGVSQVLLVAGAEMVLPMGNTVYEFAGDTGTEQLTLTVRDPQATSSSAATPTYRQDTPGQSFYALQAAPERPPYISQVVEITHRARAMPNSLR
jgi:Domain of unknown function (DUF4384)